MKSEKLKLKSSRLQISFDITYQNFILYVGNWHIISNHNYFILEILILYKIFVKRIVLLFVLLFSVIFFSNCILIKLKWPYAWKKSEKITKSFSKPCISRIINKWINNRMKHGYSICDPPKIDEEIRRLIR